MAVLQVIDEEKQFSDGVDSYIEQADIARSGLDYHIIAVFGSQSTGKSTLLNALFGTNFGVMEEGKRQQTTKGIWMGVETQAGKSPTVVLDVEGTDGRERGDDQDFERKAALFALATSEILLINMWEHQVGLYVGANMALLRTVFEVNLSLFQAGRGQQQRSRICFVIRDHMGTTPLRNLAITLKEDLEKQWESLAKPAELKDAKLEDFFDLEFAGLPHKVLQPQEFSQAVGVLRETLVAANKPEYHRGVPLDGWPVYASQVWQQIEMNKDLDLPTHQILVARFRCDEIADEAFRQFEADIAHENLPFGEAVVVPQFGAVLRNARTKVLQQYDETAGRYTKSVYNEKRMELLGRVDGVLAAYFAAQLDALKTLALNTFWRYVEQVGSQVAVEHVEKKLTFAERVSAAIYAARAEFAEGAAEAIIDSSVYSVRAQQEELDGELNRAAAQARETELRRVLKRAIRTITARLDPIVLHFEKYPTSVEHPWDAVQSTLRAALQSVLNEGPEDLGLGGTPEETEKAKVLLESAAWKALTQRIEQLTAPDAVLQRMRDRFEDCFKYSEEGLPIVWAPGDDIDAAGVTARQQALKILPVYSSAQLSDGSVLHVPQEVVSIFQSEEEEVPSFLVLLTSRQQRDIERRFQRVADAAFVDAKRSVMQQTPHIPVYIYVIIVVLGWNEFMAVLQNPLLVMLLLILGGAAYVVYTLGMANAVLNAADSTFQSVVTEGKQYLRQVLLTEDERRNPRNSHKFEAVKPEVKKHGTEKLVAEKFESETVVSENVVPLDTEFKLKQPAEPIVSNEQLGQVNITESL